MTKPKRPRVVKVWVLFSGSSIVLVGQPWWSKDYLQETLGCEWTHIERATLTLPPSPIGKRKAKR